MPSPATLRKHRLRMTKAQLIDQIDTLEQRTATIEAANRNSAPMQTKASDSYLANQERADLARFPSENPSPVLRVLPDGTVLYANDAAIAVKGLFKGSKKSTLARNLAEVCAEASRTVEVQEAEFESGDHIFAISIAPIAGETYINIYGRNITERKRAEKALAEKEAQIRTALDNMPGGMRLVDKDRKYVFFNSQYLDLYDFPEGLLKVGESIRVENLFVARRGDMGPGDPEKLADDWLVNSPELTKPVSWERKIGDEKILQITTSPMPGGGVINIVIDITTRKRAEDELRKSREQLQALADNLPEFISMKDSDERFIFVNKQFEEWVRQSRDDVIGKTVFDIYSDDHAKEFHALDRQVIDGREILSEEVDLAYPDGKTRAIIRTRFPVISSNGEMLGLGTVNHDITELKRREEELAEKEAQLRAALDNMAGGMKLVDRNLNYVLFNAQYCDLCDFPDGLIEVGGSMLDELRYQAERGDFGPGDQEDLIEEMVATYRRGKPASFERVIPSSGRALQIFIAPTPEGGYVSILTDITEHKRAEDELRAQSAILELALANMSQGITMVDRDLNTVAMNRKFLELQEFPEEWFGRGFAFEDAIRYIAERGEYGPGDVEEQVRERLELARKFQPHHVERTRPNGTVLEIVGNPIEGGGFVSTYTDITDRKRAEEALLEAKRRSEDAGKLVAEKNQMLESLSSQLSKYLSPQVYSSIFSGEQSVEIASKRKKLTVFFSDIADFTGTTDSLESEELTNLLNHYLTEMSKIALDYGATIDKYVGDAIIAFFGDPETRGVKEDATTCVNMAIAMQRRMQELQSEWLDMGLERPFQTRIGINTGFCTVGNFGSADRMDYTIIGNEVNLASRLESHAEVGGILMAHETHSLVKDTVLAEEGDTLTVKGFVKPVRSYAVMGLYEDLEQQGRIIRRNRKGLALEIDREKLTKKGKAKAIKAIKDVLSQLED